MTDDNQTLTSPVPSLASDAAPLLCLTIQWHPEPQRIGQQCFGPAGPGTLALHRFLPLFLAPGEAGAGLGHRCVSRTPLQLQRDSDGAVTVSAPDSRMTVRIDGVPLAGARRLAPELVQRGVVLELGGTIVLCLHWMRVLPAPVQVPALLGVGAAAMALRAQVLQAARTDFPVLLLGETGTGKEVAARAIHDAGVRRTKPWVAVNMAAMNESLAAADLFGAARGAYTGAQTARTGLFAEAADGTLFLDEIGDTPAAVQPMLLRVLESGEYRPLGAPGNLLSRARLIAATDRDLAGRGFNQALLRRMEAFVIHLPPLRARREDTGVLVRSVLQQWAEAHGGGWPALPAALVAALCRHDWPGNVRQLLHTVRRALVALDAGDGGALEETVLPDLPAPGAEPETGAAAPSLPGPEAARTRARLSAFSGDDVLAAMDRHGWQILHAAQALGISRPSLYKLLAAHPQVRRASAIPEEEIRQVLARHGTDLGRCASALRTPADALRRRLQAMAAVPDAMPETPPRGGAA